MLKIIGKQNKELEVDKWEVFHREEETDGTLLVVGLDQTSLASLKRTQGRAFFATKAIYFKIGKMPIGMGETKGKNGSDLSGPIPSPTDKGESEMTNSQEDRLLNEK